MDEKQLIGYPYELLDSMDTFQKINSGWKAVGTGAAPWEVWRGSGHVLS